MIKIKEKIKAIIFDMDGTIIETEHIWDQAVKNTLGSQSISLDKDEEKKLYSEIAGIGLIECWEKLKKEFNLEKSVLELSNATKQSAIQNFNKDIKFIGGFEYFHKQLKDHNISSCIATNCDSESLSHIAKKINLFKFFGNDIYNIAHVNNKSKPDPALFLHAAKKLNASPDECIVFEDSLHGFQAAKSAGMKCIGIQGKKNSIFLHHANHVIEHYDNAPEALKKIIFK
jgi:beta-phosphoglucomutase